MSEERIDIQVTDKGADKAAANLRTIAATATQAADHVDRLKASLATMPSSRVAALSSSTKTAAGTVTALQKRVKSLEMQLTSLSAKNSQVAESQKSVAAAAAAVAQSTAAETAAKQAAIKASQARAVALANEAAAQARVKDMVERSLAAQAAAARPAAGWAGGKNPLQANVNPQGAQLAAKQTEIMTLGWDRYNAKLRETQATTKQTEAVTASTMARVRAAVVGAYDRSRDAVYHWTASLRKSRADSAAAAAATNTDTAALKRNALASREATVAKTTLSLATRRSAAAMGAGAVGANAMSGAVRTFSPQMLIAAGAAGVFLLAMRSANKDLYESRGLDQYAKKLGLTEKEMHRLGKTTDITAITMADRWNGLVKTLSQYWEAFQQRYAGLVDFMGSAWDKVVNFMYMAFVGFYAGVRTLVTFLGHFLLNIAKLVANTALGIVNGVVMLVQGVIDLAVGGMNLLIRGYNRVAGFTGWGDQADEIKAVNLGVDSLTQGMFKLSGINIADEFAGHAREGDATMRELGARWGDNTVKAFEERVSGAAQDIIMGRGKGPKPKTDKTAENRAHALAQVNLQLDNELARMRLLNRERAIEQRMDQVVEALAQKRIKLTETETAAIRAKVQEIERFTHVQAEMDRLTEDALGPQRTLNAVREAAGILLASNTISQERYNRELEKANRTYQEAVNPLFQFNEELAASERLIGLYGEALERANYEEQIRQRLVSEGYAGEDLRQKMLSDETKALVLRNDALRQEAFIRNQLGGVLNPIVDQQREFAAQEAVYAELERLRQDDLINEDAYQRAKRDLWIKYNEMKLQNTASFFGALASVTKDGHGAVGAISKAAAVAEATIQGYLATQKALASAPPPWNFAAAAAVAVQTGANVAKILSTNVGSYANGGQFIVDGKSGVDTNNINMNVTKGERVTIETAKQQREADRGGGNPVVNNLKVNNFFDESEFISAMDSEEGEEVVMNIIRRRKSDTSGILGIG